MMNQFMCSDNECTVDNRFTRDLVGEYCSCGNGYLRMYDYTVKRAKCEPTLTSKYRRINPLKVTPPVDFELSEISGEQAQYDMYRIINNLQTIRDRGLEELSKKHVSVVTGFIPAPPPTIRGVRMSLLTGKDSEWLKHLTKQTGIYFVYYDKFTNKFLFWAPNREKIVKAMSAMRWKIIAVINNLRVTYNHARKRERGEDTSFSVDELRMDRLTIRSDHNRDSDRNRDHNYNKRQKNMKSVVCDPMSQLNRSMNKLSF